MTDEMNAETPSSDSVRTRRSTGMGKGPVRVGVAVAAVLVGLLVAGGFGAANAVTTATAEKNQKQTEAQPTSVPSAKTPVPSDPVSPPDRDSDQTQEAPQEDQIYLIQDGDTLTAISAQFGMSIDYIANYNAVRDVNVISEGAVLRVPFIYLPPAEATPPAPAASDLDG